ncbi:hypothetical protein [Bosea sp. FBZP-16]|uniref:hypothetical protein n=1 Tax=Bosea sp. FBZP-16 TaxID=2065382 RepID=UPI001319E4F8|nr:hypothetical protein [Bosea sp. FBZP-16]
MDERAGHSDIVPVPEQNSTGTMMVDRRVVVGGIAAVGAAIAAGAAGAVEANPPSPAFRLFARRPSPSPDSIQRGARLEAEIQIVTAFETDKKERAYRYETVGKLAPALFGGSDASFVFGRDATGRLSSFSAPKAAFLGSGSPEEKTFALNFTIVDEAGTAKLKIEIDLGDRTRVETKLDVATFFSEGPGNLAEFTFRDKGKLDKLTQRMFGQRISGASAPTATLSLSAAGRWALSSKEGFWAFKGALIFHHLDLERVRSDAGAGAQIQAEESRAARHSADYALVGHARAIEWAATAELSHARRAYQLNTEGDHQLFFEPDFDKDNALKNARLAFRHWGTPDDTVALLQASGEALLRHGSKVPESRFPLSAAVLTRQRARLDNGKAVFQDRLRARLSSKPFKLDTAYGGFELSGDPEPLAPAPVPDAAAAPAGGAAPPQPLPPASHLKKPAVQTISDIARPERGLTHFVAEIAQNRLTHFAARALLTHVGLPLPDRRGTTNPEGLWSRIDVAGTEVGLQIDGVSKEIGFAGLRGWIEIGTPPRTMTSGARPPVRLALDGARLTVRRPSDQLALAFGFRDLVLEFGQPLNDNGRFARITPAANLIGAGITVSKGEQGEPARRNDSRPRLLVHFPPQHVAEYAYARQINDGVSLPASPMWIADPDGYFARLSEEAQNGKLNEPVVRQQLQTDAAALGSHSHPDVRSSVVAFRDFQELLERFKTEVGEFAAPPEPDKIVASIRARWSRLPDNQRIFIGTHPLELDPDARRVLLDLARYSAEAKRKADPRARLEAQIAGLPTIDPPTNLRHEIEERYGDVIGKPIADWRPEIREVLRAEMARRTEAFGRATALYSELTKAKPDKSGDFSALKENPAALPAAYPGAKRLLEIARGLTGSTEQHAFEGLVSALHAGMNQREEFEAITPARLSGPSRLVFSLTFDDLNPDLDFCLDELTDWGRYDLSVTRRAETLETLPGGRQAHPRLREAESDAARILAHHGIMPGRSIEGRLADIRMSLRAPEADETAIELPSRLVLSPSQFGRFLTSRPIPDALFAPAQDSGAGASWSVQPPLWSAQLDLENRPPQLRAVWSPDFNPEVFSGMPAPKRGHFAPWDVPRDGLDGAAKARLALDSYDRHEIVALSSVFGMPVIGKRSSAFRIIDTSQIEPPKDYALKGLARTPGADGSQQDLSAIYMPEPLNVTALRLTGRGGSLNLDTAFHPPAAALRDQGRLPLFDSFSVERWRQVTTLGRDIEVEVVYKGYLFPLGIRASLVKLTERLFFRNDKNGQMTAFLVQRQFIRIGKRHKTYPAPGQGDGSRRFPAHQLEMLTHQTPDIVDPLDDPTGSFKKLNEAPAQAPYFAERPNGRIDFAPASALAPDSTAAREKLLSGLVFWPRTRSGYADSIGFEFAVEGHPSALKLPMLFVDNVAVNQPDILAAIVRYYNSHVPEEWRTAQHAGTRRRYAEEEQEGQCTLETLTWTLGAEGRPGGTESISDRVTPGIANTRYENDPILEGAEQPPFYPYVSKAAVKLGPYERFIGRSLPSTLVRFDESYRKDGFRSKSSTDPGDRYLELLSPLAVGMGNAGDRSGGIARPDVDVTWVSRRLGAIGGAPPPATPPVAGAAIPRRDFNFDSCFNSKSKILGLFTFSELLRGIGSSFPEMREQVDSVVEDKLDELRSLVLPPLRRAIVRFDQAWDDARNRLAKTTDIAGDISTLDLRLIYPELDTSLDALRQAITDAENEDVIIAIRAFATLRTAGQRLINALRRITSDPVGPIKAELRERIRRLLGALSDIRSLIAKALQQVFANTDAAVSGILDDTQATIDQRLAFFAALVRLPPILDPVALEHDLARRVEAAKAKAAIGLLKELKVDSDLVDALARGFLDILTVSGPQNAKAGEAIRELLDSFLAAYNAELRKATDLDTLKPYIDEIERLAKALPKPDEVNVDLAAGAPRLRGVLLAIAGPQFEPILGKTGSVATVIRIVLLVRDNQSDAGRRAFILLRELGEALVRDQALSLLQAYAGPIADWNATCGQLLGLGVRFVSDLLPDSEELDQKIADLETKLAGLSLSSGFAAVRDRFSFNLRRLRLALAGLRQVQGIIASAPDALKQGCFDPASETIGAPLAAVVQVTRAAEDAGAHIASFIDTLALLPTDLRDFSEVLRTADLDERSSISADLLAFANAFASYLSNLLNAEARKSIDTSIEAIKPQLSAIPELLSVVVGLQQSVAALQTLGLALRTEVDKRKATAESPVRAFAAAIDAALSTLQESGREAIFFGLGRLSSLLRATENEFLVAIGDAAGPLLRPVLEGIRQVYDAILDARSRLGTPDPLTSRLVAFMLSLIRLSDGASPQSLVDVFQVAPVAPFLPTNGEDKRDGMEIERAELASILAAGPKPAFSPDAMRGILKLFHAYQQRHAAPLRLAENFTTIMQKFLRGDIAALVDFNLLRDEIEATLRSLVPVKITRSYDCDVELKVPDALQKLVEFRPVAHPEGKVGRLVLRAGGSIDLLNPKAATAHAAGFLPGMTIKLLGSLDIVKLKMPPSHFSASPGDGFSLSIKVEEVELGSTVGFIKDLQSYLGSPKDGTGFFLRPLTGRGEIGIVAGYSIALGALSVGSMYISNLSLSAAAELPFSGGDARFVIGIGRPETPFMISVLPFAGCGYLGLIANSRRIVGFEASFEYGGGSGFNFGPLRGEGRITVGVFIRTMDGFTELYGIFFAGGEARIASFSLGCASLYVRLTQRGSNLNGVAIFTYSFRVGLADIRFSVKVEKDEQGSRQSSKADAEVVSTNFRHGLDLNPSEYSLLADRQPTRPVPLLINQNTCKAIDYRIYKRYFAYPGTAPGRPASQGKRPAKPNKAPAANPSKAWELTW